MTNLLYWAEPIDQSGIHPEQTERVERATDFGWTVFRPRTAFVVGFIEPDATVEAANRAMLRQSSALLAWLPTGVPTIGVPAEIESALTAGIPVGIVTDNTSSWAIAGFKSRGAIVGEHLDIVLESLSIAKRGVVRLGFYNLGDGQLPTRAHTTDVGLDLYTRYDTTIKPGEFADIPTGISVNLPDDKWALITGRSSAIRKYGLLVVSSIIDPGYRGPLCVGAHNLGADPVHIVHGQRIGQLILMPAILAEPDWDNDVTSTERGANGYGSSGS